MRAYVIRRLFLIVPTLFLVTIMIFMLVRFIPGSVIDMMVSEMQAGSGLGSKMTPEYIRSVLGMDAPVYVQYGRWLGGVFRGDLGKSLWTQRPVVDELARGLPVSFELGLMSLAWAMLLALPIGIYSAIRQDTARDYAGRTVAILAVSIPSFWLGTMVIVFPSLWWSWMPPMELVPFASNPLQNLIQFVPPALVMGASMSGSTMRMTRTMMLEVLRQDYVRTAWSKGLGEWVIVTRHVLKNAMIPVITQVGMLVPVLIAGGVITEQIFNLPGIGRLLVESINKRDYPIISGINLVLAAFILVINLLVDLTYGWLDPRVKYK
jgi:peptide/nickel transport system permease protein